MKSKYIWIGLGLIALFVMANLHDWRMFLVPAIMVYFIPSMIASIKGKRNKDAIILLNLFGGWTIIGWIGALVWAAMVDAPERKGIQ